MYNNNFEAFKFLISLKTFHTENEKKKEISVLRLLNDFRASYSFQNFQKMKHDLLLE